MSSSLGIFTTLTDPGRRGDHYKESLKCYEDLADRVAIVDGHQTWPQEFQWDLIGQHFQWGYDQCPTDWVIHMDIDWIFHEKDFTKIRQAIMDYPNSPAIAFYKWQFILPDRYNLKSRLVIAINKKKFGSRIKFNSGGDLCQPSFDGKEIQLAETPQAGVPFYCYEKMTKTVGQIRDDVGRMDRAYYRYFNKFLYSKDGSEESAYMGWLQMVRGRASKPSMHIGLDQHPKYIQETIAMLSPNQWGYDGFGHLERNDYAESTVYS